MLVLSPATYASILAHAGEDGRHEVCGVLAGHRVGDRAVVEAVHRVENVAGEPRTTYEMDPEGLLETMEAVAARGRSVLGFYHSHPAGPATPSETDRAQARWPDHHYVVVSPSTRPPSLDAWVWDGTAFARVDVAVDPPADW